MVELSEQFQTPSQIRYDAAQALAAQKIWEWHLPSPDSLLEKISAMDDPRRVLGFLRLVAIESGHSLPLP